MQAFAHSLSRPVAEWLRGEPKLGRVFAVFRRVCIVQVGDDRLISLVSPDSGDGPLSVVLEQAPKDWCGLQPGAVVRVGQDRVWCGELEIVLEGARVWEPCPDWEDLRAHARRLLGRLEYLADRMPEHAPADSMLSLLRDHELPGASSLGAVHARAQRAAEALWAGWCGDEAQLRRGTALLAGLGVGLTPSGDDFCWAQCCAHGLPTLSREAIVAVCQLQLQPVLPF